MRRAAAAVTVVALVSAVAACGSDADGGGDDGDADRLTVLAAASLTEAFTEIAARFADATGTDVDLSFGASSSIVDQVREGIDADVVALASTATMDELVASGDVGEPAVFARNRLAIAVPPGNPAGVTSLAELADPALTLAVCDPDVPCGALAAQAFAGEGLVVEADTEEEDVKAVLDKVASGEVDAGVVYETDVLAAGDDVDAVAVAEVADVTTAYPVAVVDGAPPAAADLVDFVLGDAGRDVLADHGFLPP